MDDGKGIEVVFGPSFNFYLEKAMANVDASPEYIESMRSHWNDVVLSSNGRDRLRALATEVGNRLLDQGIPLGDISPMRWQIVPVDPNDALESLVELRCRRFGKILLTVELLADIPKDLVEFATNVLGRSAKKRDAQRIADG